MEYALTADHHRVHAFDAEKGQEYYCPVCGNQVIPRQGEVNSWHFAHVTSCMDDWKYDMSEWHRGWQSRFPENVREIVVEHRGECHRADILMGGYVIEFQHSPISAGEFERRNKFYMRAGYKVIWVFDETYAFGNEYISSSLDDENKFVWKWPNRALASVVPQRSTDIAIVLQLTEDHDDDGCEWLVKVEWAIVDDDGYADYRRFFIDDGFAPDLFTEDGLQNILLSKRKRFDAFLRDNQPYAPKCSRIKGNPRDWYICPKTHDWHNNQCRECQNNLINEFRTGTDYRQGGLFFYCAYPRIIHEADKYQRCISHPFDFKEDSDMKKEYDTSVKEAIERVMSVFSEYIKTTPYFDIVWSGKVGYIYISIDSCRGTVGDMDCIVIDSPEDLLDKLLYEMAVDIMEEGGHDLSPVEASALERAEVERRLNVYLEQLPEYQDRISFVFERK